VTKPMINPTRLLLALVCSALLITPVMAAESSTASSPWQGTWVSVLPPLLAIVIALIFRNVIPALFIGLVAGIWIHNGLTLPGLGWSILESFQKYTVDALANRDHATVILFSLMIGGMVGITARNGGMVGIVNHIIKWANSVRRASLATVGMGLAIFFDDYANTLVVGNTMRPVTDKLRISREKLAYFVDSTAAPIAAIALITTWVGFESGLIGDAIAPLTDFPAQSGYSVFLKTIAYSFYPILALLLTILVAASGRDFGPMYQAELLARQGKMQDNRLVNHPQEEISPKEGKPRRAINALLPIAALIITVMLGLYHTGYGDGKSLQQIIGDADAYKALLWGSLVGMLTAALLSLVQGILTLEEVVDAWYQGMKSMLIAMVILILAWSLAAVTDALHTKDFLASLVSGRVTAQWIPTLIFLLAAATAFATGSSWGAMGILIPLLVPLMWTVMQAQGLADPSHMYLMYVAIASILAGAVWGDHCSPISDTTILSSMASGCDHIQHVRTQIPYALYAGSVAIFLGIIPVSFGWPVWLALLLSALVLGLGLWLFGKKVPDHAIAIG